MAITTVALVGATGALGSAILPVLKQHFTVTVISRKSSSACFDEHQDIRVVHVADDYAVDEVAVALKGQDAVVSTVSPLAVSTQLNIVNGAHKAGVKRFLPSEFGLDKAAFKLIPALAEKIKVLEHVQKLAKEDAGFSWTALVTGVFFDWGLRAKFLRFDLDSHRALILGDGETMFSATSLPNIALAVVRVLQREQQTRNKILFTQTVCTSQREILGALEKETMRKWEVELAESDAMIKAVNFEGVRNQVASFAMLHSRYDNRPEFANDLLGLETVEVETEVRKVLQSKERW